MAWKNKWITNASRGQQIIHRNFQLLRRRPGPDVTVTQIPTLIIFGWRRLTPPAFIGGAEITEGLWAALLASLGHEVWFIGSAENPRNDHVSSRDWLFEVLEHDGIPHTVKTSRVEYMWRGVKCICVPQAQVLSVVEGAIKLRPALLWTSQEGCDEIAALAKHIPVASYVHSVSSVGMLSTRIQAQFVLAPSKFVRRKMRIFYGVRSTLARPLIERTKIEGELCDRDLILFVNPIPEKGVKLALTLAEAIPDHKFLFVEGWRRFDAASQRVSANITILNRQRCLNSLYARARLLIVPSVVADAAPRVILEAGLHGVPVIGCPVGGIPELVANAWENCISAFRINRWITRTRKFIEDDIAWTKASHAQQLRAYSLTVNPKRVLMNAGILGVLS